MMSQSDFLKNAGRWGGSDGAARHYRAAVLSKVRYAKQATLEVATLSGSSSDTVDFNRSFWTTLSEDARFVWHSDQIGRMEYPSLVRAN